MTAEVQPTSQDVTYNIAVSGPEVQPPGPASHILTGQPPTTSKNWPMSLTGANAPSDEPVSDEEQSSRKATPYPSGSGQI